MLDARADILFQLSENFLPPCKTKRGAEQKMLCDIREHAGYISEKISAAGLTGHSFYVYIVPFNDAEQEKAQIMDAVLRGGAPI